MPDTPTPESSRSFMTQKIAGAPLIAWVAGGAALVGGFMWWRNRQQAASGQQTATSAASAVPTAATSEELMAAGLYQPPDITYNVPAPNIEQSVQTVPAANNPPTPAPVTTPPSAPVPPKPAQGPGVPVRTPASTVSNTTPPAPQPKYITVTPWPSLTSTLWGISQKVGVPLARIEALNPQIKNPNLIYAGQSIRYA